MTEQSELIPDLDSEDAFEVQMRGYSRRQVNEFVARSRSQTRDLEERLSRSLDEVERLRTDLTSARQKEQEEKPQSEEISERMGQILKLADDEAKAQKTRALEEITKQRAEAEQEIERLKAEAREQTERMLAAAQEQAENAIASARAEAEKTRNSARTEADRTVSDAQKKSENAVAAAQAQAKQMLDEATARATAIHDGAERRLNLLVARHTETVRRLTEVRDVVTNLVAGEAARGSLKRRSPARWPVPSGAAATVPRRPAGPPRPPRDGTRPRPRPAPPGQPPAPRRTRPGTVPRRSRPRPGPVPRTGLPRRRRRPRRAGRPGTTRPGRRPSRSAPPPGGAPAAPPIRIPPRTACSKAVPKELPWPAGQGSSVCSRPAGYSG